ncbi:MAG: DUF6212 domain-containing protein, partial [Nodosilinea sp.]
KAKACYEQSVELDPMLHWGHYGLAQVASRLEQWEQAAAAYRQAIELRPDFAVAEQELIVILKQLRKTEVISKHQQVLELQPDSIAEEQPTLANSTESGKFTLPEVKIGVDIPQDSQEQNALSEICSTPAYEGEKLDKVNSGQTHLIQSVVSEVQLYKFFVDQEIVKELYSASPKAYIAAIEREFFKDLCCTSDIAFYQLNVDHTSKQGVITRCGQVAGKTLVELTLLPAFFQGYLVASESGESELAPFLYWWKQRSFHGDVLPCWRMSPHSNSEQNESSFWKWLFQQSQKETVTIAYRLSNLQSQYLMLRSSYETIQNSLATIEAFLSQSKTPSLQLAFEAPPTKQNVSLELESESSQVKQLLPLPSQGLAAVEVYISTNNPHADGELVIDLYCPEEQVNLAKWQIPYSHLTEGWLPLDLPSIEIGRKQDVELWIGWRTRIGPMPQIGLSKMQPVPEAQAWYSDRLLGRSIAMRLWTGLPGSRRSFSPYLVVTQETCENEDRGNFGHLGQRTMSRVVEVTPNLPTEETVHIRLIDDGRKIRTHPRGSGVTVAMLPFAFPRGATTVRATVATEHNQAGVIEYAMAIIQDPQPVLDCFKLEFSDDTVPAVAFSGWVRVLPEVPHQITLTVPQPMDENCHIVFGTRLPPDSTNICAWANWLDFLIA